MATTAYLHASHNQALAVSGRELSGSQWVNRFPASSNIDDLTGIFRSNVRNFFNALVAAGASVNISNTLRPRERAYLMHWSWRIARGTPASSADRIYGVDIEWVHPTNEDSVRAARNMVYGFGIQNLGVAPSLNSKHCQGLAIDMSITWFGNLSINNASGHNVLITSLPKDGTNTTLHTVGRSFGVIKYSGSGRDDPHWSDNGH